MHPKAIKVSICIPVYNQVNYLKRNIDSILIQDFGDYEVIITDDSETDVVRKFVSSYLPLFNGKLKYHKNTKRLGSPENWNEAIKRASGEYIKILHHDDWFSYVNSLSFFVSLLDQNPNSALGFVSSRNVDLTSMKTIYNNKLDDYGRKLIETHPEFLITANYIGSPSATIFRNQNQKIYFDTQLIWFVDIDFYVSILKKSNCDIAYSDIDAISIGKSDLQISRQCEGNKRLNLFEYFYFLEKWGISDVLSNENVLNKTKYLIKAFELTDIIEVRKAGFNGKLPQNLIKLIKSFN